MARLPTKIDTLRALFARSGNRCAFPGCDHQLINDKNQFVGHVCHIEAALEGGERYNLDSNDEHRRSYQNLVLLCYAHHVETNDVDKFLSEHLLQIKHDHEKESQDVSFSIDEVALSTLAEEMNHYWTDIDRLNKLDHIFADSGLAMEVDGGRKFSDVASSAHDAVDGIQNLLKTLQRSDEELRSDFEDLLESRGIPREVFKDVPYYENPLENRNWEYHNIGVPNRIQRLRIDIVHLEVKFWEEYIKTHSGDRNALEAFEKSKQELLNLAETAMHVD